MCEYAQNWPIEAKSAGDIQRAMSNPHHHHHLMCEYEIYWLLTCFFFIGSSADSIKFLSQFYRLQFGCVKSCGTIKNKAKTYCREDAKQRGQRRRHLNFMPLVLFVCTLFLFYELGAIAVAIATVAAVSILRLSESMLFYEQRYGDLAVSGPHLFTL